MLSSRCCERWTLPQPQTDCQTGEHEGNVVLFRILKKTSQLGHGERRRPMSAL